MKEREFSNLTIAGLIGGFMFSLLFAIRYILIWEDTSQAIIYITTGVLICAVSWLYEQNIRVKKKAREQDEDIFKITAWIEDKENKNAKM